MRPPNTPGIQLLIVIFTMTLDYCVSAANPDPSLAILQNVQTILKSVESRMSIMESRLSSVSGKVDELDSSAALFGGKVERMESILNKLQLTDQERKKLCNNEYSQNLFSLHKTESEQVRQQMSSMLQEISELIRSGMGKMLIKMDSLISESSKSASSESIHKRGGEYDDISTDSTSNRGVSSGSGGSDNQISVTLIQLNNKVDRLVDNCLSQPNRGSGGVNNNGDYDNRNNNNGNNNNELMTTLAQFRSLSEDTMSTMVKKIESAENQLLTTVLSGLQVPARLSQVKDRVEENVNKLKTQVDGLSNNAPILRILRHIKTQLPDIVRVTCMDEQTTQLLEKATSQVNTMIRDYTRQIESISLSLDNVNTFVSRLASLLQKYNNSFVQSNNTNARYLRTSISSWE